MARNDGDGSSTGKNLGTQFSNRLLPFKSANPVQLEPAMDVNLSQSSSPNHPVYVSPIRAGRTIREVSKEIDDLRKENFNLKLRIFFMEEKMAEICGRERVQKMKLDVDLNIQLKNVAKELESAREDLNIKDRMLDEALKSSKESQTDLRKAAAKITDLEEQLRSLNQELQSREEQFVSPLESESENAIYKVAFGLNENTPRTISSSPLVPTTEAKELEKQLDLLKNELSIKGKEMESANNRIEELEKLNSELQVKSKKKSYSIQSLTQQLLKQSNVHSKEMWNLMEKGIDAASAKDQAAVLSIVNEIKVYFAKLMSMSLEQVFCDVASQSKSFEKTCRVQEKSLKKHSEALHRSLSDSSSDVRIHEDVLVRLQLLLEEKSSALETLQKHYDNLRKEHETLRSHLASDDTLKDLISITCHELTQKVDLEVSCENQENRKAEIVHSLSQSSISGASLSGVTEYGKSNDVNFLKEENLVLALKMEEKEREISSLKNENEELQEQLKVARGQKDIFYQQAFILQQHLEKLVVFLEQLVQGESVSSSFESGTDMLSQVTSYLNATLRLSQSMSQNLSVWDLSKKFSFDDSMLPEREPTLSFDNRSLPSFDLKLPNEDLDIEGSQNRASSQLVDKRLSLVENQQSKVADLQHTLEQVVSQLSGLTEESSLGKMEKSEKVSEEINSLKSMLHEAMNELHGLKETVKDSVSKNQEVGIIQELKENMEKVLRAAQSDENVRGISPSQAKDIAKKAMSELNIFKQQLLSVTSSLLSHESLERLSLKNKSSEELATNIIHLDQCTHLELLVEKEKKQNLELMQDLSNLSSENKALQLELDQMREILNAKQGLHLPEKENTVSDENARYKQPMRSSLLDRNGMESLDSLFEELKQTKEKLKAMESKCMAYERDIAKATKEKMERSNENKALKETVDFQKHQIDESQRRHEEMLSLCNQLKTDVTDAEHKILTLEAKCAELNETITVLSKENESLTKEHKNVLQKNRSVTDLMQTQMDKIADMNKKHTEYSSEKINLQNKINQLQVEVKGLQRKIMDKGTNVQVDSEPILQKSFDLEVCELQSQISNLKNELTLKDKLVQQQNDTIGDLHKKIQVFEDRCSISESLSKLFEQENSQFIEQISSADKDLNLLRPRSVGNFKVEHSELNARVQSLTEALNDKNFMIEEQKHVIANLQNELQALAHRDLASKDLYKPTEQECVADAHDSSLFRARSLEKHLGELNAQTLSLKKELECKNRVIQEQTVMIRSLKENVNALEHKCIIGDIINKTLEKVRSNTASEQSASADELFVQSLDELKAKIDEKQVLILQKEDQCLSLRKEKQNVIEKCEKLETDNTKLKELLQLANCELSEIGEKTQAALQERENTHFSLITKMSKLERELEETHKELSAAHSEKTATMKYKKSLEDTTSKETVLNPQKHHIDARSPDSQIHDLSNELANLHHQVSNKEAIIHEKDEKIAELENNFQQISRENDMLHEKMSKGSTPQKSSESINLGDEVVQKSSFMSHLEQQLKDRENEISALQASYANMEHTLLQGQGDLRNIELENASLKEVMSELQKELENHMNLLSLEKQGSSRLSSQLLTCQQQLKDSEAKLAEAKPEIADLKDQLQRVLHETPNLPKGQSEERVKVQRSSKSSLKSVTSKTTMTELEKRVDATGSDQQVNDFKAMAEQKSKQELIHNLEIENLSLKEHVVTLENQLEESRHKLSALTISFNDHKTYSRQYQEQAHNLETDNLLLRDQIATHETKNEISPLTKSSKDSLKDKKGNVRQYQEQLHNLEVENVSLREHIADLEKQMKDRSALLSTEKRRYSILSKQIIALRDNQEHYDVSSATKQISDLASLMEENEAQHNKIAELNAMTEQKSKQELIHNLKIENLSLKEHVVTLEDQLDESRHELSALTISFNDHKTYLRQYQEQAHNLETDNLLLRKQIATHETKNEISPLTKSSKDSLKDKEGNVRQYQEQLHKLEVENVSLREHITELEKQMKDRSALLSTEKRRYSILSKQIIALRDNQEHYDASSATKQISDLASLMEENEAQHNKIVGLNAMAEQKSKQELIHNLEIENLSLKEHVATLEDQLEESRHKLSALTISFNDHKTYLRQYQEQAHNLETDNLLLRNQIATHETKNEISPLTKSSKDSLKDKEGNIRQYQEQLHNLEVENVSLKEHITDLEKQMKDRSALLSTEKRRYSILSKQIIALRDNQKHYDVSSATKQISDLASLMEENEAQHNKIAELKEELQAAQTHVLEDYTIIQEHRKDRELLSSTLAMKEQWAADLEEKVNRIKNELVHARKSVEEKAMTINNLSVEIQTKNDTMKVLEATNNNLECEAQLRVAESQNNIASFVAENDLLHNKVQELEERIKALQNKDNKKENKAALAKCLRCKELEEKLRRLESVQYVIQDGTKDVEIQMLKQQIDSLNIELDHLNHVNSNKYHSALVGGSQEFIGAAAMIEQSIQVGSFDDEIIGKRDFAVMNVPSQSSKLCQTSSDDQFKYKESVHDLKRIVKSKEMQINQLTTDNSNFQERITELERQLQNVQVTSKVSKKISVNFVDISAPQFSIGQQTSDMTSSQILYPARKTTSSVTTVSEYEDLQNNSRIQELIAELSRYINMPSETVSACMAQLAKSGIIPEAFSSCRLEHATSSHGRAAEDSRRDTIERLKNNRLTLIDELKESKQCNTALENQVQGLLLSVKALEANNSQLYNAAFGVGKHRDSRTVAEVDSNEAAIIKQMHERKWSLQQSILRLQKELCKLHPTNWEKQTSFVEHIVDIYKKIQYCSVSKPQSDSAIYGFVSAGSYAAKERYLSLLMDIECLHNSKKLLKYFVVPLVKSIKTYDSTIANKITSLSESVSRRLDIEDWDSIEHVRNVSRKDHDSSAEADNQSSNEKRIEKEMLDLTRELSSVKSENDCLRRELEQYKKLPIPSLELRSEFEILKQSRTELKKILSEKGLSLIGTGGKESSRNVKGPLSRWESAASLSSASSAKPSSENEHKKEHDLVNHRHSKGWDNKNQIADELCDDQVQRSHYSSPDLGIESDPNQEHAAMESRNMPRLLKSRKLLTQPHDNRNQFDPTLVNVPYAFIVLEHFELLKKEIEECIVAMKSIESRANHGLKFISRDGTPKKSFECGTLRGILDCCNTAEICLFQSQKLMNTFRFSLFPTNEEGRLTSEFFIQENRRLEKVVGKLTAELEEQSKLLTVAEERLKNFEAMNAQTERALTKKLIKTKKVLRQVKKNIVGGPGSA